MSIIRQKLRYFKIREKFAFSGNINVSTFESTYFECFIAKFVFTSKIPIYPDSGSTSTFEIETNLNKTLLLLVYFYFLRFFQTDHFIQKIVRRIQKFISNQSDQKIKESVSGGP